MLEIPESRGKVRQDPSPPGRPCSLMRRKNMMMCRHNHGHHHHWHHDHYDRGPCPHIWYAIFSGHQGNGRYNHPKNSLSP